jgi:hypothetical protein
MTTIRPGTAAPKNWPPTTRCPGEDGVRGVEHHAAHLGADARAVASLGSFAKGVL